MGSRQWFTSATRCFDSDNVKTGRSEENDTTRLKFSRLHPAHLPQLYMSIFSLNSPGVEGDQEGGWRSCFAGTQNKMATHIQVHARVWQPDLALVRSLDEHQKHLDAAHLRSSNKHRKTIYWMSMFFEQAPRTLAAIGCAEERTTSVNQSQRSRNTSLHVSDTCSREYPLHSERSRRQGMIQNATLSSSSLRDQHSIHASARKQSLRSL